MSAVIDDGGPAYPGTSYSAGMTLREYLSGQALAGMAANPKLLADDGGFNHTNFKACCDMADALISALKGGPKS